MQQQSWNGSGIGDEAGRRHLIISPEMLAGKAGRNINGPAVIKAPEWVDPLGRYYLYFAHHQGDYIRLAYAERLTGPWTIRSGGVLHMTSLPVAFDHIASPDVIVDDTSCTVRLYFHGRRSGERQQLTYLAVSTDGLNFSSSAEPLGPSYFRVFRHGGCWYAIAKGGVMYRSQDGTAGFERGGNAFGSVEHERHGFNSPGSVRHVAVTVVGDCAEVYYSRIGDAPERILRGRMPLIGDWRSWRVDGEEEVVRPEAPWEGAGLPIAPSKAGPANSPVHQLRDPFVYSEGRKHYLLYAVAGEQGIALTGIRSRSL